MHAVFKTEGNDATERQHQEQCQNSQSFVRNRLAKTFPTVKTPAKCGFTPGMLSERETRYLRNQNEFWHHLWCLGDLRRRIRRWCRVYRRPSVSQQRTLHEPCNTVKPQLSLEYACITMSGGRPKQCSSIAFRIRN